MTRLMRCTILAFVLCAGLILLLTGCPTPEQPHAHTYATAWTHSATEHWHAASCGHTDAVSGKAAHTWSAYASNNDATTAADGTKTRACTVCGRTETVTDEGSRLHVHTYAEAWSHDTTEHWHAATCSHADMISGKVAHTFVGGVCSICGRIEGCEYVQLTDLYAYLQGLPANTKTTPYRIAVGGVSGAITGAGAPTSGTLQYALYKNGSKYVDLILPATVTSIGEYAFKSCSSLTSVTIPASVTSIGSSAFYSCSNLTSVTIPASVTSIGDSAFEECSSLAAVTIPDSVTSIGYSVFRSCSRLSSVTIPASVTSIGVYAFWDCSLTSVTIPASVTSIGANAFQNCNFTTVVIPDSVTEIMLSTFWGCTKLTSVTIPESVTSIGSNAFWDCSSLASVTIPASVTRIGSMAFQNCSSLTSITFAGTTEQWAAVTKGTDWNDEVPATTVTCSDGTVLLGDLYAYLQKLPANTKTTPYRIAVGGVSGAITGAGAPTSGTLQYALYKNRAKYVDLILPATVTSIGGCAFSGCSSLTSVTIPASVTSIGNSAFSGCSSLTSVTIPASVTSIGNSAFYECSSLTSATIPASVTSIGNSAFYECSSLTSVTIPAAIISIGNWAFVCCSSLTSVTIPASVTSIGEYAFERCSSLTSITFAGTTAQWVAVTKGSNWNDDVPATTVTCSDGTAAL